MANPKAKLKLVETEPKQTTYISLAIIPQGKEYVLVEHEMTSDHKVVSTTISKPMQYFMAVFTQKQRSANVWTCL